MAYRDYSTARGHIVAADGSGDFTTISTALAAASSGQTIFIRPGTYTENPTLKAGVNLCAFDCDNFNNVTILGKCSFTGAGTVAFSGIQFQTNSDYAISVTGSNNSALRFSNCQLTGRSSTPGTVIQLNSSGLISSIYFESCYLDLQTSGIAYYNMTAGNTIQFIGCFFNNSGSSSTLSNNSSGNAYIHSSGGFGGFSSSSTGSLGLFSCDFDTSGTGNFTVVEANGTGSNLISNSYIATNTAVPTTVDTGCVLGIYSSTVNTSNANICSGAGTLTYSGISCPGNSGIATGASLSTALLGNASGITYSSGTFTPAVSGTVTAGSATYLTQNGSYTRVGNKVFFDIQLNWNTGTGTGNLRITGLPFTSSGSTAAISIGAFSAALGAGITGSYLSVNSTATTADVYSQDAVTGALSAVLYQAAAILQVQGFYSV